MNSSSCSPPSTNPTTSINSLNSNVNLYPLKSTRQTLTPSQKSVLHNYFRENRYPNREQQLELSRKLNLSIEKIRKFFDNRRTKFAKLETKNKEQNNQNYVIQQLNQNDFIQQQRPQSQMNSSNELDHDAKRWKAPSMLLSGQSHSQSHQTSSSSSSSYSSSSSQSLSQFLPHQNSNSSFQSTSIVTPATTSHVASPSNTSSSPLSTQSHSSSLSTSSSISLLPLHLTKLSNSESNAQSPSPSSSAVLSLNNEQFSNTSFSVLSNNSLGPSSSSLSTSSTTLHSRLFSPRSLPSGFISNTNINLLNPGRNFLISSSNPFLQISPELLSSLGIQPILSK